MMNRSSLGYRIRTIVRHFILALTVTLMLWGAFAFGDDGSEVQADSTLVMEQSIRFGIVTFYNPRVMVLRYQPFMDALSQRTPYKFELVLAQSYEQTVERLEEGEIYLAYLGPVTFIRAKHRFGAIPLVRLNTGGSAEYHSMIAVRDDSGILDLESLRGKDFAFGAPLSTSSHLYPRLMLASVGIELEDLGSYTYYRHHDSAARAVLTGQADACGIRDVTAERFAARGLRVIAVSDPIPNFPLVVSPGLPDSLIDILRSTLLALDPGSPADSLDMAQWDLELRDGFAPVDVSDYDAVEEMMLEIFGDEAFDGNLLAPGATLPARTSGGLFH